MVGGSREKLVDVLVEDKLFHPVDQAHAHRMKYPDGQIVVRSRYRVQTRIRTIDSWVLRVQSMAKSCLSELTPRLY